jgi:hypothetical protein
MTKRVPDRDYTRFVALGCGFARDGRAAASLPTIVQAAGKGVSCEARKNSDTCHTGGLVGEAEQARPVHEVSSIA